MTVIYNCHSDGLDYRITKFEDGNPTSSYLCSPDACECPAGHRPTCRHRQMLPEFTSRHLVNSHLFWNHDGGGFSCDFAGNPARETVPEGLHDTADGLPSASLSIDDWRHAARAATVEITEQIVRTPLPPAKWRRL